MDNQQPTYQPGVCNINTSEIRKRRKIGLTGLTALLVTLGVLFAFKLPAIVWLITFIPGFLMATGFLQAKHKFCVGYASASMRHTDKDAEKITDQKAVSLDKKRAKSINLQALTIGLAIAALSLFAALLAV